MQKTSTAYQAEMKRTTRSRQFVRVKFGLIDLDAAPDTEFAANGQEYYSSFEHIANDKYKMPKTYATFEQNRMILDNSQIIASKTDIIYQGYVSSVLSDENGIFQARPIITIEFDKAHQTQGLSFVFDKQTGDCCSQMQIKTYNKNALVDDVTAEYDSDYGISTNIFEEFDRIELIFLKSNKPYRRARLQTVIFGIGYIFDNSDIISFNKTVDVDPLNRRLPINTAKFVIQDLELSYNIDNPKGIWDTMEKQLPVYAEFGQYINQGLTWGDVYSETWGELELNSWGTVYEGGYTEWVSLGEYILSGKPVANRYQVTFECQDLISYLMQEYHEGIYSSQGKSLYDIAVELIEFCELLPRVDKKPHYVFSDILKEIKTTAPIPIKQVRELLQLIAHAANCTFYTDIDNIIHIEPINAVQDNFYLNNYEQLDMPKGSKIPQLQAVITNTYHYFVSGEKEELGNQTINISGTYQSIVKFEPATEITITVSIGTLQYTAYASAAEITITGEGECEIIITGKKILNSISETISNTGLAVGEFDLEDNPLITSIEIARAQAEYTKDYLTYRTTYNLDNVMGYPEVETGDLINLQSQFTEKFPARVLKHDFSFTGAAKSKFIIKRLVK